MTSGSDFTGAGLPLLTAVVLLGAVIPVVPTGAAVSAAAAVAIHGHYALPDLAGVLLFGAAGAYGGDVIVYALLRWGGERISGLLSRRAGTTAERLAAVEQQLEEHQITTLLVSRLIPGGRVPVLLAAAVAGYPFKRFAVTDTSAAALWCLVYAAVGVLGGSLFPHPWEGIVAAVALAVVIGAFAGKLRGLHDRHTGHDGSTAPESPAEAA